MNDRHIVFDVDGTLLSSSLADMRGLQDTVAELTGQVIPLAELRFSQGIPGVSTLKQLKLDHIPNAHALWVENAKKYMDSIALFDGIADTLNALYDRGYSLGIVTSRLRREFDTVFPRYGVAHLFGITICADDKGAGYKPTPAPLLRYMELAHTTPDKVLYVGDSVYDSQCAHSAGTAFALALWDTADPSIPAEHYLEYPQQLLSFLAAK